MSLKYKQHSKKEGLSTISSSRSITTSGKTHRRSNTESKSLAQSRATSANKTRRSNKSFFENMKTKALHSLLSSIEHTY